MNGLEGADSSRIKPKHNSGNGIRHAYGISFARRHFGRRRWWSRLFSPSPPESSRTTALSRQRTMVISENVISIGGQHALKDMVELQMYLVT